MSDIVKVLLENPDATNAVAAISGVIIATLAFLVSVISLVNSIKSLKHHRRHNILTVKPIPEVTVANYENSLRIRIRNNGTGPLLISRFIVKKGNEERDSMIKWMNKLPNERLWTHFATDIDNRSILPGKSIPLLELTEQEGETDFSQSRDVCREWLNDLECLVDYSDIYGSKFDTYSKKLDWFKKRTR